MVSWTLGIFGLFSVGNATLFNLREIGILDYLQPPTPPLPFEKKNTDKKTQNNIFRNIYTNIPKSKLFIAICYKFVQICHDNIIAIATIY